MTKFPNIEKYITDFPGAKLEMYADTGRIEIYFYDAEGNPIQTEYGWNEGIGATLLEAMNDLEYACRPFVPDDDYWTFAECGAPY